MTYTTNIPLPSETLGGTQARIQQNFELADTHFKVNHIAYNNTGAGKHKYLQLPESGTDFDNNAGAPATATNEGAFYAKQANSVTTLYFRSEANGSEYQMTSANDANIAKFGSATSGWTFLPGGLVLQYGATPSAGASGVITFDRPFSAAPYSITLGSQAVSAGNTGGISNSTPPTATDFNYFKTGGTILYWMAIGPE